MKDEYAVVYTLSDHGDMVRNCLKSLRSLSRFVDREDIIIFYTPPRTRHNLKMLLNYATVVEANNITEPFVFQDYRGPGRYGEKVHLCEVDRENVIFLDCDTEVKKDPTIILEWECDFAGRAVPMVDFDLGVWFRMFRDRGKEPVSMFNAGFMVFRNGTHKRIIDEWLSYLDEDLPQAHAYFYHKDQYSLALALSGLNLRLMTREEHAFRWLDEEHVDSIVLHGTATKFKYIKKFLRNTPWGALKRSINMVQTRMSNSGAGFWDRRYELNPRKGSGVGSRGYLAERKLEIVQECIKEDRIVDVLDLGCGDLYWMKDLDISYYTGLDFSRVIIEKNQELKPAWIFKVFDFSSEKVAEEADLVVCFDVLIHQPSFEKYNTVLNNALGAFKKTLLISGWRYAPKEHGPTVFFYETIFDSMSERGVCYQEVYSYRESVIIKVIK